MKSLQWCSACRFEQPSTSRTAESRRRIGFKRGHTSWPADVATLGAFLSGSAAIRKNPAPESVANLFRSSTPTPLAKPPMLQGPMLTATECCDASGLPTPTTKKRLCDLSADDTRSSRVTLLLALSSDDDARMPRVIGENDRYPIGIVAIVETRDSLMHPVIERRLTKSLDIPQTLAYPRMIGREILHQYRIHSERVEHHFVARIELRQKRVDAGADHGQFRYHASRLIDQYSN